MASGAPLPAAGKAAIRLSDAPPPEGAREKGTDRHMQSLTPGKVINGRYRVERLIGRGGMGTVYAVRHVNTDEKLALKLLHPALAENQDTVRRFRTEVRAPIKIGSEHVVRVVDADISEELGNVPFMVMERLQGRDLRGELKRRGALPAGEVVLYMKQISRALDKAHKQNIIHRDLKPANLYITEREDGTPHVKILDFGIAKLTDAAQQELTQAGQVFGTPWYMAPEQARTDLGKICPQTDLWALGLITYQLLTGRNYWTADGMAALVSQICYEPMPAPTQSAPHLGPLFDMWFGRACNRAIAERFGSASEQVRDLAHALGVSISTNISTGSMSARIEAMATQQGPHTPSGMHVQSGPSGVGSGPPTPAPHTPSSGPVPSSGEPAGPRGAAASIPSITPVSGETPPPRAALPSAPFTPQPAIASQPIPGTSLAGADLNAMTPSPMSPAAAIDAGSAPPFAASQPTFKPRKSSSFTAVLLGIIVAVTLAAGGTGVYLALTPAEPEDGAGDAQAGVPTSAAPDERPPDEEPEPTDEPSEPSETPGDESTAAPSVEPTTAPSAEPSVPPTGSPVAQPTPPSGRTVPQPGTQPKPPPDKPKPGPAPDVGKIDF